MLVTTATSMVTLKIATPRQTRAADKSERMGAHYSRHVESEANITRAFKRLTKDAS
ncbi:hypothetical protein [Bradyrhizobium sp. CCBAU 53421]|uniref:hypothetical protein n=1 Tax=Bradyrhizobium sp. CCBAU 53421 TaxID=1325120 RepID=UPI00188ABD94|nr:hypothetical protein [Bradyrhizobium sp. CCBAU 53421]